MKSPRIRKPALPSAAQRHRERHQTIGEIVCLLCAIRDTQALERLLTAAAESIEAGRKDGVE